MRCFALLLVLWVVEVGRAATEVYFAPGDRPTDVIVREIGQVKSNLLVQAYSFTSAPIAKAVVDAHRRGVKVTVLLDKSQSTQQYSSATFLANAGVPTFIDSGHAIAHNKLMILDGRKVITGSFNFTKAAEERNAENLVVIDEPRIVYKYMTNWQAHAKHSVRYERKVHEEGGAK